MKIKFVNEIPQWIISSDVAAYHPASKTIWIRNNLGWKTIPTLLHELTHWFIHKFLGNNEKLHSEADKLLKYNGGGMKAVGIAKYNPIKLQNTCYGLLSSINH